MDVARLGQRIPPLAAVETFFQERDDDEPAAEREAARLQEEDEQLPERPGGRRCRGTDADRNQGEQRGGCTGVEDAEDAGTDEQNRDLGLKPDRDDELEFGRDDLRRLAMPI